MIDLHYWTTPNGHKITMFLEETGLEYKIIPVNIGKGEQFKADFLKISPNNRIPALLDHKPKGGGAPVAVFESGAMLVYLAEKTGKFLPADGAARYDVMQWLFWQMGGLGPMSGQNNHFSNYAVDKIPYAMDRYRNEVNRLYGVMNTRLTDREYLAGDYSIADMASYPWVVPHERQGQKIDDFPHLKRWLETIREKPATKRAYELVPKINPNAGGIRTAEERAILFGQTAQSIAAAAAAAKS
jgi:GSH-dependent disulfide-bond oxidoreductase